MSGGSHRDLDELRNEVVEANRALMAAGLVTLSFGNASGVDRERGVMLIKPSGFACDELSPQDVVAVSLEYGRVVEDEASGAGGRGAAGAGPGPRLRPSSDTATHLVLYRRFPSIGGVVHTHSPSASVWAQAGRPIPCLGTTHADHFAGPVPVTRPLTHDEIAGDYEAATGVVIVETLDGLGLDPLYMPAALVSSHGPFTWGADPAAAAVNAVALEAVATMAWQTLSLAPEVESISPALLGRHFHRKHGPDAYYGQTGG